MSSLPDLWTCPRCGARSVTANMWHGCGDDTVDAFFEGKPERLRELSDACRVGAVHEGGAARERDWIYRFVLRDEAELDDEVRDGSARPTTSVARPT